MNFSANSRIWIYQSNRELTTAEVALLEPVLHTFALGWTAHNHQLKAAAEVRYNRFFVLTVDETQAGASGCSIDKSVNLMKSLEQEFGINLFDRFNIAYRTDAGITSVGRNEFESLIKLGLVNADTIVFNNLVATLAELDTKWEVPFKDSWHKQVFGGLITA